ncbi:MAG TPA: HAD-IC family P-type ATPase, partial [Chloroflexota bacterium]|nr:HAD-IC family P-type ATPase [Chloroflexota bacterium]
PADLRPIALVALAEDLRPDAHAALAAFWAEGVTIKVLSGDNSETVLAIAKEAGFPANARAIGGGELAGLSEAEFARAVREVTVFGRVDPEQKERIIRELRGQGHTVGMIGDGANDILAMKAAQLAIAMASGSPATRGAADVVLLRDTFATLPAMLGAGRQIVNAMHTLIDLFLIRDIATIELIAVVGFIDLAFPLLPPQVTIAALLTVGIPSLFLVGWAPPRKPPPSSLRGVVAATLALGSACGLSAILADLVVSLVLNLDLAETRTAVVSALVLSGLIALVLLIWRQRAEAGRLGPSPRVGVLAAASFGAYLLALHLPTIAQLFAIEPISALAWLAVLGAVAVSFGGMAILRRSRFDWW